MAIILQSRRVRGLHHRRFGAFSASRKLFWTAQRPRFKVRRIALEGIHEDAGQIFDALSIMGWLAKLFGAVSLKEMNGIRLDTTHPFWFVDGETDFPALLGALPDLLPQDSVLYFEGGSPSGDLLEFLRTHEIPERVHVALGTLWPKPAVFHVPATPETMKPLAEIMTHRAYPELAIHFHVYHGQTVLLEWHDAFTQSMFLSGELPEDQIQLFAERLKLKCERGNVEPRAAANH